MPRTANPYTQIIKRFAKLQAKADKLNAEIAAFTKFVEMESKSGKTAHSPIKAVATASVVSKSKRAPAKKAKKGVGKKAVQKHTMKAVAKPKTPAKPNASQPKKPTKFENKQITRAKREIPMRDGKPDYLATLNWDNEDMPVAPKGKKK